MRIQLRNNDESAFQPYMDYFPVDGCSLPLGTVLVLPGGGYSHRAYHEGDPIAKKFNALGYQAFVLQYRVMPDRYPAAQQDVLRAIRIIRSRAEEFRVIPDQIAVCGYSAGGHLAACAGLLHDKITEKCGDAADDFSAEPNALLLCYPVVSVTETYTDLQRPVPDGTPYRDENGKDFNPCEEVTEKTPPSFIWHTATDQVVPYAASVKFAQAMWSCGNICELHIFPRGRHGLGLGYGLKEITAWPELAAQFLESNVNFTRA